MDDRHRNAERMTTSDGAMEQRVYNDVVLFVSPCGTKTCCMVLIGRTRRPVQCCPIRVHFNRTVRGGFRAMSERQTSAL